MYNFKQSYKQFKQKLIRKSHAAQSYNTLKHTLFRIEAKTAKILHKGGDMYTKEQVEKIIEDTLRSFATKYSVIPMDNIEQYVKDWMDNEGIVW